jgi:hypothetical protein
MGSQALVNFVYSTVGIRGATLDVDGKIRITVKEIRRKGYSELVGSWFNDPELPFRILGPALGYFDFKHTFFSMIIKVLICR